MVWCLPPFHEVAASDLAKASTGRYEAAIASSRRVLERTQVGGMARAAWRMLIASYVELGREAEARAEAKKFLEHHPNFSVKEEIEWRKDYAYKDNGAVKGACDDVVLGNLTKTLANIKPAVAAVSGFESDRSSKNAKFVQAVADKNVELTLARIRERSAILRGMVDAVAREENDGGRFRCPSVDFVARG